MEAKIFKDEKARQRLEEWYLRFLDRAKVKTESIEISTSFGKNHVLTAGDPAGPPLVCLHAMLTGSAHLVSELGTLANHFYLIAPDLPGQSVRGLPMRLSYTDDSHSKWLKEILDGLQIKRTHLLGVSLGGFVARQFASNHPEMVQSLILIVPAGIAQGSVLKGLTKMAVPMMMYKMRRTEKRLRNLAGYLLSVWDEDWAGYLGDSFNDFIPHFKIPPLATDDELRSLSMPCLVIAADQDISFPGEQVIERSKNHIPEVESELIRGRHSPPTTPEFQTWLGNRVTDFLKRV
jgi:2-hydroxy-6-oxonona-2,4-dienedioate hydrolase